MTMLPSAPESDRYELRQWRQRHGLSMRALGEYLGVTWLAIQRWETGMYNIPPYLHLALREVERQLPVD